ncbi:MAG: hypothetical protein ABIJ53_08635 [Verrucomicrobiota bacterium]
MADFKCDDHSGVCQSVAELRDQNASQWKKLDYLFSSTMKTKTVMTVAGAVISILVVLFSGTFGMVWSMNQNISDTRIAIEEKLEKSADAALVGRSNLDSRLQKLELQIAKVEGTMALLQSRIPAIRTNAAGQ